MTPASQFGDDWIARAGIFRIRQDLDASSASELRARILDCLREHGAHICIDLAEVGFVDSTGLGMLISVLRTAQELNGNVALLNPSRPVRRLLQCTGLDAIFLIAEFSAA
jgi:anti-sigma B factor antagonist